MIAHHKQLSSFIPILLGSMENNSVYFQNIIEFVE